MINLSQETEALARRLAAAHPVTTDAVIRQALEARVYFAGSRPTADRPRDRSPAAITARRQRMEQVVSEIAAMPILDQRTPSEIVDDLNDL